MIIEEGEKVIEVECEFTDVILAAYPKLKDTGGYELLRCQSNSKDLLTIGERISSPKLLKRIYIRPIQRDLCVEIEEIEDRENTKGVGTSPVFWWYMLL